MHIMNILYIYTIICDRYEILSTCTNNFVNTINIIKSLELCINSKITLLFPPYVSAHGLHQWKWYMYWRYNKQWCCDVITAPKWRYSHGIVGTCMSCNAQNICRRLTLSVAWMCLSVIPSAYVCRIYCRYCVLLIFQLHSCILRVYIYIFCALHDIPTLRHFGAVITSQHHCLL